MYYTVSVYEKGTEAYPRVNFYTFLVINFEALEGLRLIEANSG